MTITITIATDNEAFVDDPEAEIARILTIWVQRGCQAGPLPPDYNGNQIGHVSLKGRRPNR